MKKFALKEWMPSEEKEQEAIFEWAKMMQGREPRLALLNASMNGILTNAQFGAKLKRLGRKKGFPDINLPVPRVHLLEMNPYGPTTYYGLYIELKRLKGGVLSPEQRWWHQQLTEMGYRVEVAKGARSAIDIIKSYLED